MYTVIKPDSEERRMAMFKDNKLRLLMTLVGFQRLGAYDDTEATWVISSSLTSSELQETIDLLRKFEFDPPVYEDGKGPEDMLRSKAAAARRSTRRVEFDDDSDGIDHDSDEDLGEYALDGPTARKGDGAPRKKLKRRVGTPVELDDEEREQRAQARREKELAKQQKVKSHKSQVVPAHSGQADSYSCCCESLVCPAVDQVATETRSEQIQHSLPQILFSLPTCC